MDYDLVALCIGDTSWILLKHPLLFDCVFEFYSQISSAVKVFDISCGVSMAEYIFIKETLGSHITKLDVEELKKKCELILSFMRTFKKKCGNTEFKLCDSPRMKDQCMHIIYLKEFGKSFVSECGLHICQFYGDFHYVDTIDLRYVNLAKEFFDGKNWENKDALHKKVQAFKILFST